MCRPLVSPGLYCTAPHRLTCFAEISVDSVRKSTGYFFCFRNSFERETFCVADNEAADKCIELSNAIQGIRLIRNAKLFTKLDINRQVSSRSLCSQRSRAERHETAMGISLFMVTSS